MIMFDIAKKWTATEILGPEELSNKNALYARPNDIFSDYKIA
ncbi:hypothetical protein [Aristophania vespae]|nr:hypothetical protein [Aristophania vespae]UMM63908.1 hypothetical protein DM15PD_08880 [Aristophania vespae]